MSDFIREDRYVVINRSDMEKTTPIIRKHFSASCRKMHDYMLSNGAPARSFLVIESDWPEFEVTYKMIEDRMAGLPSELESLRNRLSTLERALGGMLFAFDDGVGKDWSEDLLDFVRSVTPAVEFKAGQ